MFAITGPDDGKIVLPSRIQRFCISMIKRAFNLVLSPAPGVGANDLSYVSSKNYHVVSLDSKSEPMRLC